VLNEEKWVRLANALVRRPGASGAAGVSASPTPISAIVAPSPTPSAPIVAVPLAAVQASPAPTPLEKGKGVVEIASNKDSVEGPVFKRRRAMVTVTSHSTTEGRPSSFMEHPPSASSPRGPLAIEGGGESAPEHGHTPPAPKLPAILQHALQGFQREATV